MENKAHAMAAGAFVLLVAALLIALAVWLTRDVGAYRLYDVVTRGSVTGLQSQATVRFRGVKVGKVDAIGFDPAQAGQVVVRIAVEADAPITRSTYATLGYQGLTGIAFLQLDDTGESAVPLVSEAPPFARIPMHPGAVEQWSSQGERLLAQLEETARRVNALLDSDNQRALRQSLLALKAAAAEVPPALRETRDAAQSLRAAADSVRVGAGRVGEAADEYTRLARHLQQPGGTLEQLEQGLGALTATGQQARQSSLPRVNRTMEDAGRTARQVGRVAARLDESPQALIFGPAPLPPGPGEPGFVAPGGAR